MDANETTTPPSAAAEPGTFTKAAEADVIEANLSAVGSAKCEAMSATGSAVGVAQVGGDSVTSLSVVGVATAKGASSISQSYVSAFVGSNEMSVRQSATASLVARTVTFEQSAGLVTLSGDAHVRRGFVGILLAGDVDISEDSKVLLTGRALLVLCLAMLGGFGLVALAMIYSARRLSAWRPTISLPKWSNRPR